MRLNGKTAIVTGGGTGFGAGIVQRFAAEGARVLVADASADAAEAIAEEIGATACRYDPADGASVTSMMRKAEDLFGTADILVNAAALTVSATPMAELAEAEFDRLSAHGMKPLYLIARHLLPGMKNRKSGVILNVASSAGVSPRPELGWSNAARGWTISATRAMAAELAPFGIRVNAVNPVVADMPVLPSFMGGDSQNARRALLATIPMGRLTTPEDVGHAAVYLCSDEAEMITGVALDLDGGRTI